MARRTTELDWKGIEALLEGTGLEFGTSLFTVWVHLLHKRSSSQSTTTPVYAVVAQGLAGLEPRIMPADCDNCESDAGEAAISEVDPGEDLWKVLPNDVQVQVLTFLHPRDVLSFACVSQSCRSLKDSAALWKRLWFRDYAWVVTCWEPGRQALERSGVSLQSFEDYNARFYFCFATCYLSYVLASHNTTTSCLVGLGGHVYDMTSFLPAHPGSQETVLVHAGRCATTFFAGIRHSYTAQKLAQKLCVLVDTRRLQGGNHRHLSGLRPTSSTKLVESPFLSHQHLTKAMAPVSTEFPATPALPPVTNNHRNGRRRGAPPNGDWYSLSDLRAELRHQEAAAKGVAVQRYAPLSPLQDCHVYLDPFSGRWMAWYTDHDFDNVFVDL